MSVTPNPPAPLTERQQALLLKMRKGGHGGLSLSTFSDLCTLFHGWSIVSCYDYKGTTGFADTVKADCGAYPFTEPDLDAIGAPPPSPDEVAMPQRIRAGERQAFESGFLVIEQWPDEIGKIQEWLAEHRVATIPNANAKGAPQFIVHGMSEIGPPAPHGRNTTGSAHRVGIRAQVLVRVKILRITAPSGIYFDVVTDYHVGPYNKRGFDAFMQWAAANTDLLDQVNAVLGTEPHLSREQRPRTEDNVGTCGICTKEYKLDQPSDTLVMHGYARPGIGYIVGQCFGVGFQPYELSAAACEAFLRRLGELEIQTRATLKALRDGSITSLPAPSSGKNAAPDRKVTPVDPDWATVLAERIAQEQVTLTHIAADQEVMRERIARWTPHPELIQRPPQPGETPNAPRRRRIL